MKIGYARVSTEDQQLESQIELLEKEGCEKIYQEKKSGASSEREALKQALGVLRKGDVLGELLLMMDEEAIYKTSVISLENYEQAGFFSRFSDYLELIFLDES